MAPKLKTPETEASGVSILITRSTVGAASSGSPSGRPPAFAGAATSGCAGFQNSDLRRRPALQLDRWPTFRLGSVSCPSARPAANLRLASTVPHFRSSFGDPSSLRLTILVSSSLRPTILVPSGLRRMALPPARPTTYLRFASVPSFGSAGGFIRLAPHAAPAPPAGSASGLLRLLSPSGFTGRRPLGLRLATASPVVPPMHSLFQLNLASPAEPSMSIPFPPALASSGITQLNNFRLAPSFASSGASSDPSAACASGFTLCPD